ncbi:hypothetical protein [Rhodovibrio salinarum]|uniref:Uncharacterized protein n=1 Tax=Rhodovibrio salinarum TaxID=1087 RepID=A0A934QII5_9PROT|nr:hypothetical protein [Rhodovibrio salinarum]MBK1697626.1 hypothetical protein [Rhodovibrio salinarum]
MKYVVRFELDDGRMDARVFDEPDHAYSYYYRLEGACLAERTARYKGEPVRLERVKLLKVVSDDVRQAHTQGLSGQGEVIDDTETELDLDQELEL